QLGAFCIVGTEMTQFGIDYRARVQIGTDSYQYYNPAAYSTVYGYPDPNPYISPTAITQAGKSFVIEYIGGAQSNGYLRPADVTALQSQGLSIVSVFEKKMDVMSYYQPGQGAIDGEQAITAAQAAGQTSGAIYFGIDVGPGTPNYNLSQLKEYLEELHTYFVQ